MKIKQICIILLLTFGIAPMAHSQSFDKLWKQVDQAEKKSLPKTVIQLTTDIYRKAEAERNSPQMLKAYTWRMKYRESLTPDSFYVGLKGLQQWAETTDKPMDRAVLHSLIAGIYADYAAQNRWQLRRSADLMEETPPADIRTWSGNLFVEQVLQHTREALKDQPLLMEVSARTYTPFVELGDASEYYRHDMYHLLGTCGVSALETVMGIANDSIVNQHIEGIFNAMIAAYRKPGFEDASVLVNLDYLNWRRQTDRTFVAYKAPAGRLGLTQDPYLAALGKLMTEYKSADVCAEVYLAKANYAVEQRQPASALQICDEAIGLYPGYKRIDALKRLKQEILTPELSITSEQTAYPETPLKLNVTHKNLDGFTVRMYRVSLSELPAQQGDVDDAFYRKHCRQISEEHFNLIRPVNYLVEDTTFTLKAPGDGLYLMQIVPDAKVHRRIENFVHITHFKVLTHRLPGKQYEIVTLDGMSGQPIANATVVLYAGEDKPMKELTTDAAGKVQLEWNEEYRQVKARKGLDTAMPLQYVSGGYYAFNAINKQAEYVTLLTDRSLYRPGQTVYVKGIAYAQQLDAAHVIAQRNYTLTLLDANGQEVAKKELRTNEFGSFTTDFTLPAACLNGTFTLRTEQGMVNIRVEDYKRPTFDITFDKPDESYQLGDKIMLKGKAQTFSGVPLQELPVQYTVNRYLPLWWGSGRFTDNLLASGTVVLNNDGTFSIPVTLEKGKETDVSFYHFVVKATVTNVAGETQTSSTIIAVGDRSILLGAKLESPVCKDDSIRALFTATNLNGTPVSVDGTVQLYRITNEKTDAIQAVAAYTGTFTSNINQSLEAWKNLPSGGYQLVLSGKDDQGRDVTYKTKLVLFSLKDTRPAVESPTWLYQSNTSFDAQHPATFYFGTSYKDAYVLMDVFCGNQRLESRTLQLSDSIVRFDFPYDEAYGNGLLVSFCFVKDQEVYTQNVELRKRLEDKTLNLKWDVFRDKLRPGQQEEWKLTIRTPQALPAEAEMLATMYDASLDKIWKQSQMLRLNYYLPLPYTYWQRGNRQTNGFYYAFATKDWKVAGLMYDRFSIMPLSYGMVADAVTRNESIQIRGASPMAQRNSMKKEAVSVAYVPVSAAGAFDKTDSEEEAGEILPEAMPELRTNFAETAFFYPQLRTNEQGEVSFSFTMPQSLTSWNFRGYAHTKNMFTGMLNAEATTSKEFMLTPNLPRFVRVGDQTSVAASIANLTGKNLSGVTTFTLFDPMTEKVISTQKQKFAVEAGKTIGISFMFPVTDKYEVLGCRMIAEGGTFSDGEQQMLPVLSNKENLTETVSMPIRGKETRTFSLDSLFNGHSKSATDRRLTVEFTGNPAWYAVQALPSLDQPKSDNAISWASMYYANTLASFIMNSQPRIKAMFESWKQQGGTKETFLSNLQKNQEVKNIILSESPWVLEAKTEQQQKERIATLFDLNNIRNNNLTALTKLKQLQLPDGSWSWYKGMMGNSSITNFIVETNARLAMLTGEPLADNAQAMQQAAFDYLHKAALKEYQAIRKAEKEGHKTTVISDASLNWLYLLAISGEKVPAANEAAYQYFLAKLETMLPSMSMADRAKAAIALQKAGRTQQAQAFMASLKEHLIQTPEQGMYFAFYEPTNWSMLRIPAHVDVMEAFELVTKDAAVVEEMKIWLLKQKQTQQWDSPVSTVDAVYALLSRGTSLIANQGDVRITIAGEVMETAPATKADIAGLGYIKRTFTDKKVVDANKITVQKQDAGIAWGAVYGQYLEDISQVKQQGGSLDVEKKLYVERLVNNTRQLQPVTPQTVLAVGDKVVSRLTIRLDRPMEFIQLKDQRAACFEPISDLSGYRWIDGFGTYVDIKDASTNFFFDSLGKGVFVLEHSYRVSRAGTYEAGLATIQSAYAPEFVSHSASTKVQVK